MTFAAEQNHPFNEPPETVANVTEKPNGLKRKWCAFVSCLTRIFSKGNFRKSLVNRLKAGFYLFKNVLN